MFMALSIFWFPSTSASQCLRSVQMFMLVGVVRLVGAACSCECFHLLLRSANVSVLDLFLSAWSSSTIYASGRLPFYVCSAPGRR